VGCNGKGAFKTGTERVSCGFADNVTAAIAAVRPAGVDSKTKTDQADGNGKDFDKVRRFVTAAKLTTSRQ
jgi:hypothetical protein